MYRANPPAPLYSDGWPIYETLNYYGNTHVIGAASGQVLQAPFYLIAPASAESEFFTSPTTPKFAGLTPLYAGNFIILVYGSQNITLPAIDANNVTDSQAYDLKVNP